MRSADGVLHRVIRHATTRETIAKLESTSSNLHLDCECRLDNGEPLCWIGGNQYRQVRGNAIYTADAAPGPRQREVRNSMAPRRDAPARRRDTPLARGLPRAVLSLKTGNDWSLIRAWREHLNISTQEMAPRLGVDHSIYVDLERPRPQPRPSVLERVSHALGVAPEQLDDSQLGEHR